MPRDPSTSKNCTRLAVGASGEENVGSSEVPSTGNWSTPLIVAGGETPTADRIVGQRSFTWWNCRRTAPPSVIRCGQCTTSGSRTPPPWAIPLYQRIGVLPAIAQPRG
jgi:hypothetical protein